MSLRPGIGAAAMYDVASEILRYNLQDGRDVPLYLQHGGRSFPLGRYLRGKLRAMVGHEEGAPQWALEEAAAKLSLVRRFAFDNSRSVKSVFEEINRPHADALAARDLIKGSTHEAL